MKSRVGLAARLIMTQVSQSQYSATRNEMTDRTGILENELGQFDNVSKLFRSFEYTNVVIPSREPDTSSVTSD